MKTFTNIMVSLGLLGLFWWAAHEYTAFGDVPLSQRVVGMVGGVVVVIVYHLLRAWCERIDYRDRLTPRVDTPGLDEDERDRQRKLCPYRPGEAEDLYPEHYFMDATPQFDAPLSGLRCGKSGEEAFRAMMRQLNINFGEVSAAPRPAKVQFEWREERSFYLPPMVGDKWTLDLPLNWGWALGGHKTEWEVVDVQLNPVTRGPQTVAATHTSETGAVYNCSFTWPAWCRYKPAFVSRKKP